MISIMRERHGLSMQAIRDKIILMFIFVPPFAGLRLLNGTVSFDLAFFSVNRVAESVTWLSYVSLSDEVKRLNVQL